MDIIVEIGTAEQKELIRSEISVVEAFEQRCKLPSKVFVPADFDDRVNRIQGTDSYRSARGHHTALAKALFLGDDFVLVLSPNLYTESYDPCTRYNIYFHEMFHTRCHRSADAPKPTKMIPDGYRSSLYSMYDEYQAVRGSYELSFLMRKGSFRFLRETCLTFKYHSASLVDPTVFYHRMNSEISYCLATKDFARFNNVYPTLFDQCALDLVYTFGIVDAIPHFAKHQKMLRRSPFVTTKTIAVVDYFRQKYEVKTCDLEDGLNLVVEFYKSFGLHYYLDDGNERLHIDTF